jgi:F-type H+-transporting ATPase subunit epsilon
MAQTIQLEIVTPEKRLLDSTPAEYVEIPGKGGRLGIFPGHAPLLTEIDAGELSYHVNGQIKRLDVSGGFAEVLPEKITILAEKAEEMDITHA